MVGKPPDFLKVTERTHQTRRTLQAALMSTILNPATSIGLPDANLLAFCRGERDLKNGFELQNLVKLVVHPL